ncbi:bifunctional hydroxymethylpyrimidine kinase/phosphomethylpyrimidine kinase [Haloarcula onubensis]|uniref:Bifunctional hydroxymethylpyrimidine kinase/phosphomethylpyrimidine kinase n=1 Tax=Haloarcula onubensis TaxID=2950539 RepID=A0ABU2FJR3_9EURY|nr:bifunctional hydroxymethylpyrimidine kinase/phosphomethylpyrimidine kinase [Halomicroarcula sp. S3CR25-11]MDS0280669.1 bifunctional hydroxymethylpyrimidine kinase/phosphomethylpyrimidine kinase [Halomicroarcula sp. S3CR25-11]
MQRRESPVRPPVVLTIAGSDSGGGAGIQADIKTIEAGGGFGTSAVTSVTAQNTTGVQGSHRLPTDDIAAQIRAVCEDFDVAAVKTGMLAARDVVDLVAERAEGLPNLVVDPVMVATSGDRLLAPEAEDAYEDLIAEAALVTPNADEAEVLTGRDIDDPDDAAAAGRDIVEMGADAALVKGGHVAGDDVVDVLVTDETVTTYRHDRVDTGATHGSGCTLSAAIATRLAHGDALAGAVASGIDLLARAVRYNLDVGEGPGAVHHTVELRDTAAREATSEAVESVVAALTETNLAALVPESGMAVAGATPYAERPDEVAAVDGRITLTMAGPRPAHGVRFGAEPDLARFLLAVREHEPSRRFAVTCRLPDDVEAALESLDGPVTSVADGEREADATPEALVERAVAEGDDAPVAIVDPGAVGVEGAVVVLADGAATAVERVEAVLDAVS